MGGHRYQRVTMTQTSSVPLSPRVSRTPLEEAVRSILIQERWLDILRLQHRLREAGTDCGLDVLRKTLRDAPLAQCLVMHPPEPGDDGEGIQIVLWNESVR